MKVPIIEDEIMAQKSLVRLLSQNFPDITVVNILSSVKGAVSWLKDNPDAADVIFMDVELSDGVCFEIFRQTNVKAKVIMTTAYDHYAVKAFETGSVDYLLKPIDSTALKRAGAWWMSSSSSRQSATMQRLRRSIKKDILSGSTTGLSLFRRPT